MNITLDKFEVEFLRDSLRSKQLEYKSIGLKTGTINSLLEKLTEKPKEEKECAYYSVNDMSDQLIVHEPDKGRLTIMEDGISDEMREKINNWGNYIIQENIRKQMESYQPNLNIPFIKR